jgi:hypothetical protein
MAVMLMYISIKETNSMENVKFIRYKKNKQTVEYFFLIHERLGDYIRKYTKYKKDSLQVYLSDRNLFRYEISIPNDFENFNKSFTETIERISNSGDDKFFFYHLITDDGHPRTPRSVHDLMRKEYGLIDIDEAEEDNNSDDLEKDLEWWTAHFFIRLICLAFHEPLESFDEGEEDYTEVVENAATISEILSKIKSIDTIVVVDDARKIGHEEMKKILKNAKQKKRG